MSRSYSSNTESSLFHAAILARVGKSEKAKTEATKALELSPSDPLMMYNAACFYSRLGDKKLAFKSLKSAFTTGFENYEWIKRDTDLENIRKEPAYIQLMKGK